MELPPKYTGESMVIIGKNDVHVESMVNDPDFYAAMKQKNDEANRLENLANPELTKAGYNAAQDANVLVTNTNESWVNCTWRPAMAWMYLSVCTFDFIIFPVLWSILQLIGKGSVTTQWQPLSLQGAGLFHIAMGAVLGIATYGRTQEKLNGVSDTTSTSTTTKITQNLH